MLHLLIEIPCINTRYILTITAKNDAAKKQKQGVCMVKKVLAKVLYFLLFLCVIGCPAWRGWVWKKLFY